MVQDNKVDFVNYNYTYQEFFSSYKNLMIDIISQENILTINRKISTFISTFLYTVPDDDKKIMFIDLLYQYHNEIQNDKNLKFIKESENIGIKNFDSKIEYYKIYYYYFFKHMKLFGEFGKNIITTFMPHKQNNNKYVRYINNNFFIETLSSIQKIISEQISNFNVFNFLSSYNSILVYYYGFYLYIPESYKNKLESILEILYSELMNEELLYILKNYNTISSYDRDKLMKIQHTIYKHINSCNSLINEALSEVDIFPKIYKKKYIDMTLI